MVPRVQWNPSFMKVLIILYYDKLTRSVGPVDYIALMEPPTSRAEKLAHLQVLWSEFWSNRLLKTRHFRSQVGVANVKVGVVKKIARALRAFFILRTPLYKILDPPLPIQYFFACHVSTHADKIMKEIIHFVRICARFRTRNSHNSGESMLTLTPHLR